MGIFILPSINVVTSDLEIEWQNQWNWFLFILLLLGCFCGMVFVSLFKNKILALYQFGKFALVGALNTFIDFGF